MIPSIQKWIDNYSTTERHKRFERAVIAKYGSLEEFYRQRGAKVKEARIKKLGIKGYSRAMSEAGKRGRRSTDDR